MKWNKLPREMGYTQCYSA